MGRRPTRTPSPAQRCGPGRARCRGTRRTSAFRRSCSGASPAARSQLREGRVFGPVLPAVRCARSVSNSPPAHQSVRGRDSTPKAPGLGAHLTRDRSRVRRGPSGPGSPARSENHVGDSGLRREQARDRGRSRCSGSTSQLSAPSVTLTCPDLDVHPRSVRRRRRRGDDPRIPRVPRRRNGHRCYRCWAQPGPRTASGSPA